MLSVSPALSGASVGRARVQTRRRVASLAPVRAASTQEPRQRRTRKGEEEEGISLFGRRVIVRVEPEPEAEPEPYYEDDKYDERRAPPRRPAARQAPPRPREEEKQSGNGALDSLLGVFGRRQEDERDDYAPRNGDDRPPQRRNASPSRRPPPEYYDDEPPRNAKADSGNGGGLLSGLSALGRAPAALADFAEELSFARSEEKEKSSPRRVEEPVSSRPPVARRRLVRRDEPEQYYDDYEEEKPEEKKPLVINRRAAIAACLCCGGAVAATGYFGTGAYQKNIAMSMALDMVEYEDALAERKKYLFQNLAGAYNVLEVGVGTGPNMTYYPSSVEEIIGLDPNEYMRPYSEVRAQRAGKAFKFVKGNAEDMENIPDSSVDAVVTTLTLCSVGDAKATLEEISRVLVPGGCYLFIEHVGADFNKEPLLAAAQTVVSPFQQVAAGGCHLTRNTGELIRSVSRMVETPGGMARWGPPPRSFLSDKRGRPAFLFDRVMIEEFTVPGFGLISPHVAGLAFKPELDFL